jgi:hypothetical protein
VTSPLSDDPPQREDERSVEDIAREVAGHTHDHAEDHRCWACIRVAAALRIEREARERAEAERDQIRMFLGDASPKSEKLWKEWLAERDSLSKRLTRMEAGLREIVTQAESDDGLTAWNGADIARRALADREPD